MEGGMQICLDHVRPAPEGWLQAQWPTVAITLLQTGGATHNSFDHDLGDDERGTRYNVLLWIE